MESGLEGRMGCCCGKQKGAAAGTGRRSLEALKGTTNTTGTGSGSGTGSDADNKTSDSSRTKGPKVKAKAKAKKTVPRTPGTDFTQFDFESIPTTSLSGLSGSARPPPRLRRPTHHHQAHQSSNSASSSSSSHSKSPPDTRSRSLNAR